MSLKPHHPLHIMFRSPNSDGGDGITARRSSTDDRDMNPATGAHQALGKYGQQSPNIHGAGPARILSLWQRPISPLKTLRQRRRVRSQARLRTATDVEEPGTIALWTRACSAPPLGATLPPFPCKPQSGRAIMPSIIRVSIDQRRRDIRGRLV